MGRIARGAGVNPAGRSLRSRFLISGPLSDSRCYSLILADVRLCPPIQGPVYVCADLRDPSQIHTPPPYHVSTTVASSCQMRPALGVPAPPDATHATFRLVAAANPGVPLLWVPIAGAPRAGSAMGRHATGESHVRKRRMDGRSAHEKNGLYLSFRSWHCMVIQ